MTRKLLRIIRGSKGGNSTGHESADTRRSKYTESVEQIDDFTTAWWIAKDTLSEEQAFRYAKKALFQLYEELRSFEEGITSGEATDGRVAQDAQEIDPDASGSNVGLQPITAPLNLPGGRQLLFELFCFHCSFQCWECPVCSLVRCACVRCGCSLDGKST
jgi:hypothetical protein